MVRLLIADDHQMIIDGLKAILRHEKDLKIVGEALNGEDALSILEKEHVDIVLLDINMPKMDGIETTKAIRRQFPDVKIIILTMHNRHEFIAGLIHDGASGYILKNTGKQELLDAISDVQRGKTFFSKEVASTVIDSLKKPPAAQKVESARLTDREKEVLTLIAREYSTKEIAGKLFISENTVETHRKNLMFKLKAKNVAALVKFAIQTGLID